MVQSILDLTVLRAVDQGRYVHPFCLIASLILFIPQSWSSSDMSWARHGANTSEDILRRENMELSKQVSILQAKFETLQYVLLSIGRFL